MNHQLRKSRNGVRDSAHIAPISHAAAASLTLVQDALLSFAPDSAANNTSQATSSQVTETSLTALRMKDGSHRQVSQRKPYLLLFPRT